MLSAESSAESNSEAGADEPIAQFAMCSFEPINSKTWYIPSDTAIAAMLHISVLVRKTMLTVVRCFLVQDCVNRQAKRLAGGSRRDHLPSPQGM